MMKTLTLFGKGQSDSEKNFKYIRNVNIKHKIIQAVAENMGGYLYNLMWRKPYNYHSNLDIKKIEKQI